MSKTNLPQWDLSPIYSSIEGADFSAALDSIDAMCKEVNSLMEEDCRLSELLPPYNRLLSTYETLGAYTSCHLTTDTANEKYIKANGDVEAKSVIVTETENRFLDYLKRHVDQIDDHAIADYRYVLGHMVEDARHKMSLAEEVLAADLARSGSGAFERLFDTMTSSISDNGRTLTQLRGDASNPDRKVREDAYRREKKILYDARLPIAAALNGVKGTCLTLEERQGWTSPLEHSAFISRISKQTLDALIGALEANLGMFREYFRTKARLLGLEELAWYDVVAPVTVAGAKPKEYSFDDAHSMIVDCYSAFSPEMGAFADRAFREHWIDAEPHSGKVGGAYDVAFPDAGVSRVFTNFTCDYSSVSTLAHELGHAYHDSIVLPLPSLLYSYPMTLAETASIFGEQLLFQKMLSSCTEEEAIPYIESFVGDAAQVCVDILSRFHFEFSLFERRKDGEVGADEMSLLMAAAQERTYGDAVVDKHELMWAVKGHYYSVDFSFYNYPYAFGQLFALALYSHAEKDPGFHKKYVELLSMSGRAAVEDVAASAGLDVTSQAFWQEGLDVVARYAGRLKDFADKM